MSRDLRAYSRQTTGRLVIGFLLVLIFIGDGLILIFYGREAALMGLLCLAAAGVPLFLIALIMNLLGWIVRRAQEE